MRGARVNLNEERTEHSLQVNQFLLGYTSQGGRNLPSEPRIYMRRVSADNRQTPGPQTS